MKMSSTSNTISRAGARTFGTATLAGLFLVAAFLLASPFPSSAACDSFCENIPSDLLNDVPNCDSCIEEAELNSGEKFRYDDESARCDDDADGCCDTWCRWVPANTKATVPRCQHCDTEKVGGLFCPGWCNWVPASVHSVVGPCANRCN